MTSVKDRLRRKEARIGSATSAKTSAPLGTLNAFCTGLSQVVARWTLHDNLNHSALIRNRLLWWLAGAYMVVEPPRKVPGNEDSVLHF